MGIFDRFLGRDKPKTQIIKREYAGINAGRLFADFGLLSIQQTQNCVLHLKFCVIEAVIFRLTTSTYVVISSY